MSSRLHINVAPDGLTATITVDKGDPVSGEDFILALAEAQVTSGLDRERCDQLVADLGDPGFCCEDVVIAQGRAVEPSRDAWLEPLFAAGIQAGHVREDGTIDYHNRELLKSVSPGEILARVHSAVPGKPGLRVDGSTVLPTPPAALNLKLLAGVVLESDGHIRATRSGVILYLADKSLDVVERHVHDGSVDMHSGNLHMQGSLAIKGDVSHAFSVVATGDLDISGSVEAANVVCGGSVRIQRGIRGGEGTYVHASGSITTHHAQTAELVCGGTLTIGESINSRLCAADVRVSGRVRGGLIEAESRIVAHEVGAPNGTETILVVAKPLELNPEEAHSLLVFDSIPPMSQRGRGRGATLVSDRAHRGPDSLNAEALQRLARLERRRDELQRTATVEVDLAHPGVTIQIGSVQVLIVEAVRSMCYRYDNETGTISAMKLPSKAGAVSG